MTTVKELRNDLILLVVGLILLFLTSCSDSCEVENVYNYYEPVYTTLEEIRSSVELTEPSTPNQFGKLYYKNGFLFINEPNEGIHIYDNRDPANPVNKAFLSIPGNFDLSINGNILYADSYIDLVAIDISDMNNPVEVDRIENHYGNYNSYGFYADPEMGVVTDWALASEVSITESDCETAGQNWAYYSHGIAVAEFARFDASAAVSPTNPGMGGSMARMTIANKQLFTMLEDKIKPVDITMPSDLKIGTSLTLDWGIETLFPSNDNLFVGANDGMYILDIKSPLNPELISNYSHVRSCDPVIVDGDLAYVTLRSGTECQGFTNQLEVIDISDLENPQLLYIHEMSNPHGLGKDGDQLFICDGDEGLKVFDSADPAKIGERLLSQHKEIFAYDVIPFNNVAMLIGPEGLYQYDYSDLNDIKLLSVIRNAAL